jgi:membrane complex biogenesis BtpA family protein
MSWFSEVFQKEKIIVASMYLPPLPGSPDYQHGSSLAQIIDYTRAELTALQEGGMDGVCIGNQQDWPYSVGVGPETPALAARVISEASAGLSIPIGISVFWDDLAALAIAKAVGAKFVRGVFRGTYTGEMGMMTLNSADALRYRRLIDAEDVKLMFMLRPILCKSSTNLDLASDVKNAVWASKPDAFALCGPIPGEAPTLDELNTIAQHSKGRPVLMNNGANPENIGEVLNVCNGAVIATHLRKDHKAGNPFDRDKVAEFMDIVDRHR